MVEHTHDSKGKYLKYKVGNTNYKGYTEWRGEEGRSRVASIDEYVQVLIEVEINNDRHSRQVVYVSSSSQMVA